MTAALPKTMLAVRLTGWGQPPEVCQVPVPVPGSGELLLRVDAAGLCHSDLHVMDADPGVLPYELPFTLGHEVAGTVVGVGPDVSGGWIDQVVAVYGVWSCGECRACRGERENYCRNLDGPIGAGLGRDGGLAEFMLIPSERYLVPARGVMPADLAPLTDAGLTAFHAISPYVSRLDHGGRVAVIGVGGLGHLAIQLLRAISDVHITAIDTRPAARELAGQLGADLVAVDCDTAALLLAELPGGADVDVVFDFVGSQSTLTSALTLLGRGAAMVIVGSGRGQLVAAKNVGLPAGWTFDAPFWGSYDDLVEVIDLARSNSIAAETEIFALEDAVDVYRKLRDGGVSGRAVLVPALSPQV